MQDLAKVCLPWASEIPAESSRSHIRLRRPRRLLRIAAVSVRGWDVIGVSGVKPDIAPSELVPVNWGVYPPDTATIDHLFELGYRDMEAWLDANLDERTSGACVGWRWLQPGVSARGRG